MLFSIDGIRFGWLMNMAPEELKMHLRTKKGRTDRLTDRQNRLVYYCMPPFGGIINQWLTSKYADIGNKTNGRATKRVTWLALPMLRIHELKMHLYQHGSRRNGSRSSYAPPSPSVDTSHHSLSWHIASS